jgi:hypothetical protein
MSFPDGFFLWPNIRDGYPGDAKNTHLLKQVALIDRSGPVTWSRWRRRGQFCRSSWRRMGGGAAISAGGLLRVIQSKDRITGGPAYG